MARARHERRDLSEIRFLALFAQKHTNLQNSSLEREQQRSH